jgi:hypothetical protein
MIGLLEGFMPGCQVPNPPTSLRVYPVRPFARLPFTCPVALAQRMPQTPFSLFSLHPRQRRLHAAHATRTHVQVSFHGGAHNSLPFSFCRPQGSVASRHPFSLVRCVVSVGGSMRPSICCNLPAAPVPGRQCGSFLHH